jgi:hypothetical protein
MLQVTVRKLGFELDPTPTLYAMLTIEVIILHRNGLRL